MNLLTIIGARPQFIKAAVLSRYIRDNPLCGITETIVHTGQHYDQNMSDIFFQEMDIPQPDINLHVGSGNHGKTTGQMLEKIEEVIIERKPDAVLVYGDTNSTLAGALAASKLHVPVAHVEAGLRSFMMAMPEEQNRRLTDHLSTWLFCPTETAVDNLKKEGIYNTTQHNTTQHNTTQHNTTQHNTTQHNTTQHNTILPSSDNKYVAITGDIMYEASLYYREKSSIKINEKDFILMTIHRAENTDNFQRLSSIVKAINSLVDYQFIFPIHPRTRKILQQYNLAFASHVKLTEPVGYLEMIALESACSAILTDSGGVQKEAFFFRKPCITMRDSTEWVELVKSGWNTLTGADTEKIINAVKNINIPNNHPALYGDGKCAEKICAILA